MSLPVKKLGKVLFLRFFAKNRFFHLAETTLLGQKWVKKLSKHYTGQNMFYELENKLRKTFYGKNSFDLFCKITILNSAYLKSE